MSDNDLLAKLSQMLKGTAGLVREIPDLPRSKAASATRKISDLLIEIADLMQNAAALRERAR